MNKNAVKFQIEEIVFKSAVSKDQGTVFPTRNFDAPERNEQNIGQSRSDSSGAATSYNSVTEKSYARLVVQTSGALIEFFFFISCQHEPG